MKIRLVIWLWLGVALAAAGCSTGDTGPTGPKGDTGSANVIYSEWISPATWGAEIIFGVASRTYTMADTLLTQEIIDQGVVLVYLRVVGFSPAIVQLPMVFPYAPGYSFSFLAQAGSIKVMYYSPSSPTTLPEIVPSANVLRYVLIPGGALAASKGTDGSTREQEAADLRALPYSEVCHRYGVPE